jgi:hypothetical protein
MAPITLLNREIWNLQQQRQKPHPAKKNKDPIQNRCAIQNGIFRDSVSQ